MKRRKRALGGQEMDEEGGDERGRSRGGQEIAPAEQNGTIHSGKGRRGSDRWSHAAAGREKLHVVNERTDDGVVVPPPPLSLYFCECEQLPNFALLFSTAGTEEVTWENRAPHTLFPPQLTLSSLSPNKVFMHALQQLAGAQTHTCTDTHTTQ